MYAQHIENEAAYEAAIRNRIKDNAMKTWLRTDPTRNQLMNDLQIEANRRGQDSFMGKMWDSLMQWGNRWLSDTGGPAELVHRGCGAVVHAELRCEHGHAVELADLDLAATT